MLCVYRSFDYAEATIIADLLMVEGCAAHCFENGLSRINWPYVIAYGGFRVVVPDGDVRLAVDILARWRAGDYGIEASDDPACPRCSSTDTEANPNYRGWAFVVPQILFGLPLVWPLKWRERCKSCGFRWKAKPAQSYAELAAATEAATRVSS